MLEDISSKLLKIRELPKFFQHYFFVVQALQIQTSLNNSLRFFYFLNVVCLLLCPRIVGLSLDKNKKQSVPETGMEWSGNALNRSLAKENATKLLTKMIKGSGGFREIYFAFIIVHLFYFVCIRRLRVGLI